jgi:16S rRNA (guanine527-N7)-methyltransferase
VTSLDFQERLAQRATASGVIIPPELATRLAVYYRALAAWNQKMNLVGFTLAPPSDRAIDRLFIEPLLVAPKLTQPVGSMIDLGSGGGSPAIPLALAVSPTWLSLVEARSRKAVFLKEVLRLVDLSDHADVQNKRFEELGPEHPLTGRFDLLTIRAVRIEPDTTAAVYRLLRPGGIAVVFAKESGETDFPGMLFERRLPLVDEADSAAVFQKL